MTYNEIEYWGLVRRKAIGDWLIKLGHNIGDDTICAMHLCSNRLDRHRNPNTAYPQRCEECKPEGCS